MYTPGMSKYFDTGVTPSKSLAEHQERKERSFDFTKLKPGEHKVIVLPAFDFRNGEDSQYGQHSAELVFAKANKRKAVHVTFYTGWTVSEQPSELMCTGLGTHYRYKKDCPGIEYAGFHSDCPYTGGKCWFQVGSSVYGDTIQDRLVLEGSAAVWDEIDKELNRDPFEEEE